MRRVIAAVLLTAALAACSSGSEAKGPSASVTVTTLSAIEREVEAAYLKSWDVYADAALSLTTAGLEQSYAEPQLQRTRSDIEDRIQTKRTARFRVDHDYSIDIVGDDLARVHDRYRNHSVLVDPVTHEPTEPDPNTVITDVFTLRRIEGTWKVTNIQSA